ncbi:MFS transporter [Arenibacter sp. ARW7G5Y1]|uniref:MFS transporter n=1 Tax=Arenibacter sp. ARW7G5Y1 TaxID=2135619 RepID=UPI000D75716F|nr:MFS transporter [Arenibacter sp. ARW7G5Y1]PXX25995.1 sugar phosphate permease [Arenibacter sp. ARW7G5Y1]
MSLTTDQKYWRKRIFVLTWLAYAGFYFGRKNLSVTWSSMEQDLGLDNSDYASIIFVYSLIYTIGQFVNGYLSDTFGPRKVVTVGLFLAAIGNLFLGMTFSAGVIVFLIALNGYGQSTGWSGLIKNMTPWFRRTERGIVMSWWSTCYVTGGFLATIFATYAAFDMEFLSELGWKRGFIFPSLILFVIAFLYLLFTRNNPEDVGLPKIVENKYEFEGGAKVEKLKILGVLLRNSSLWIYSSCYMILKMTRYAFLFWLPVYLEKALQYGVSDAGYMSSVYELIGFFGVILAGYSSDKIFNSNRFSTVSLMMIGLGLACLAHPYMVPYGKIATVISIALIGIATYGPDSLICTAGSMDVGGTKGAAMAAGIINGMGSVGQMFSGFIVVAINEYYGWNSLFYFFVIMSFIGGGLAALKWNQQSSD